MSCKVASVGNDYKIIEITLTPNADPSTTLQITTDAIVSGDIITNDKVALSNAMNTEEGSGIIKSVSVMNYEAGLSPSPFSTAMDIVIYDNLATDTLGLDSGDVFVLDQSNNTALNVRQIEIESTDYDVIDAENTIATKDNLEIPIRATLGNSISFSLTAREAVTYDSDNRVYLRFEIARD